MSKTQKAGEIAIFTGDVSEISTLNTQFDVIRFMKRAAEFYRCTHFMVLNLPPITSRHLSENTIITNWPTELISLFDRHGLMQTSTMLRRLRASALPFVLDLEGMLPDDPGFAKRELFARFAIGRGACFPVHEIGGARGAVTFWSEAAEFDQQQMMELMYLSVHVFERLVRIRSVDIKTSEALTEREVDCLNWTAAGKTSAEIAEILGLSEHTVNHYLNRAARKLDTVNRTQAVAKALRTGLIK